MNAQTDLAARLKNLADYAFYMNNHKQINPQEIMLDVLPERWLAESSGSIICLDNSDWEHLYALIREVVK